ncbi:N utilization substance protein B homolog [Striga asiatica]|uniref:N utilization substance protein B homolog n=1 Tax=Striga asiatica TaxID=4170 RepID=A0A5A7P4Q6_STRAF|nr:N utilization substance protein B homolog [Striga asiatica]
MYFGVPLVGDADEGRPTCKFQADSGCRHRVEVSKDKSEMYSGQEVAKAIDMVVYEELGEGVIYRAQRLSEKRKASTERELDETVDQLRRICMKKLTCGGGRTTGGSRPTAFVEGGRVWLTVNKLWMVRRRKEWLRRARCQQTAVKVRRPVTMRS